MVLWLAPILDLHRLLLAAVNSLPHSIPDERSSQPSESDAGHRSSAVAAVNTNAPGQQPVLFRLPTQASASLRSLPRADLCLHPERTADVHPDWLNTHDSIRRLHLDRSEVACPEEEAPDRSRDRGEKAVPPLAAPEREVRRPIELLSGGGGGSRVGSGS